MLQQSDGLALLQLHNHITQYGAHSVEALIGLADIVETHIIEEYLLHNEDGDSLAEFRASLHDSQAEWDNLGGEEKVDDIGGVVLDKGANDAKRGETEVFEGSGLRGCVKEWVEEERDVGYM